MRIVAVTGVGAYTDWARICNKEGNLRIAQTERKDTLKWE